MSKQVAFRGLTLYLFLSGIVLLLISPFLTWFYFGINFVSPPQVSLLLAFEQDTFVLGRIGLPLYTIGVVAAVMIPLVKRKPVFFQGILSVLLPLFILVTYSFQPYFPLVLTTGLFTAFLGSILLEASYFSYRRNDRIRSKVPTTEVSKTEKPQSVP